MCIRDSYTHHSKIVSLHSKKLIKRISYRFPFAVSGHVVAYHMANEVSLIIFFGTQAIFKPYCTSLITAKLVNEFVPRNPMVYCSGTYNYMLVGPPSQGSSVKCQIDRVHLDYTKDVAAAFYNLQPLDPFCSPMECKFAVDRGYRYLFFNRTAIFKLVKKMGKAKGYRDCAIVDLQSPDLKAYLLISKTCISEFHFSAPPLFSSIEKLLPTSLEGLDYDFCYMNKDGTTIIVESFDAENEMKVRWSRQTKCTGIPSLNIVGDSNDYQSYYHFTNVLCILCLLYTSPSPRDQA
eukprot:TRINITY_DN17709_c0_g2_i1.p1 TRINITY_DN17709_c0_g2~~TRINITY_DN17709_c0_g2_i1.p1  ORF type:complete len:312 (+),score=18.65 TRINITY_DN17709_c0_g2_i1:61-936(+)